MFAQKCHIKISSQEGKLNYKQSEIPMVSGYFFVLASNRSGYFYDVLARHIREARRFLPYIGHQRSVTTINANARDDIFLEK